VTDQCAVEGIEQIGKEASAAIKQIMTLVEEETNYLELDRNVQMRIRSTIMRGVMGPCRSAAKLLSCAGFVINTKHVPHYVVPKTPSRIVG